VRPQQGCMSPLPAEPSQGATFTVAHATPFLEPRGLRHSVDPMIFGTGTVVPAETQHMVGQAHLRPSVAMGHRLACGSGSVPNGAHGYAKVLEPGVVIRTIGGGRDPFTVLAGSRRCWARKCRCRCRGRRAGRGTGCGGPTTGCGSGWCEITRGQRWLPLAHLLDHGEQCTEIGDRLPF
jgi:hypothetical protein